MKLKTDESFHRPLRFFLIHDLQGELAVDVVAQDFVLHLDAIIIPFLDLDLGNWRQLKKNWTLLY